MENAQKFKSNKISISISFYVVQFRSCSKWFGFDQYRNCLVVGPADSEGLIRRSFAKKSFCQFFFPIKCTRAQSSDFTSNWNCDSPLNRVLLSQAKTDLKQCRTTHSEPYLGQVLVLVWNVLNIRNIGA